MNSPAYLQKFYFGWSGEGCNVQMDIYFKISPRDSRTPSGLAICVSAESERLDKCSPVQAAGLGDWTIWAVPVSDNNFQQPPSSTGLHKWLTWSRNNGKEGLQDLLLYLKWQRGERQGPIQCKCGCSAANGHREAVLPHMA